MIDIDQPSKFARGFILAALAASIFWSALALAILTPMVVAS